MSSSFVIHEITRLHSFLHFPVSWPLDADLFEMVDFYGNICNGAPDIHQGSSGLSPYQSFNRLKWKRSIKVEKIMESQCQKTLKPPGTASCLPVFSLRIMRVCLISTAADQFRSNSAIADAIGKFEKCKNRQPSSKFHANQMRGIFAGQQGVEI